MFDGSSVEWARHLCVPSIRTLAWDRRFVAEFMVWRSIMIFRCKFTACPSTGLKGERRNSKMLDNRWWLAINAVKYRQLNGQNDTWSRRCHLHGATRRRLLSQPSMANSKSPHDSFLGETNSVIHGALRVEIVTNYVEQCGGFYQRRFHDSRSVIRSGMGPKTKMLFAAITFDYRSTVSGFCLRKVSGKTVQTSDKVRLMNEQRLCS